MSTSCHLKPSNSKPARISPPNGMVVTKGTGSHLQTQTRSQPIPIKSTKNEQDSSNQYDDVDTEAKYEMATWNMYVLITTARLRRAMNRSVDESLVEATLTNMNAVKPSLSELDKSRSQGCSNPISPAVHSVRHQSPLDDYDFIFDLE
ncbi:hypothetical protein ACHAXN_005371 [Cyclotella atomus]